MSLDQHHAVMAKNPLTKDQERIRRLLVEARALRDWSQADAAGALGTIKPGTYIKIEQRGSVPKWLLTQFSLVFGIPVDKLIPTRLGKVVPFPARTTPKKSS